MPGALRYAVMYGMVWVVIGSQKTVEHIGGPEMSATNQSTLRNTPRRAKISSTRWRMPEITSQALAGEYEILDVVIPLCFIT